jgi:gamma-glutamylcyclotransferase (GGCT)/AIG2-like uncharacterized protein YtfP
VSASRSGGSPRERPPAGEPLRVFAYGTLKQGLRNHAAYCKGTLETHAAETWGRLFVWEPGIPILQVPDEKILVMGSQNLASDLAAAVAAGSDAGRAPSMRLRPSRGWRKIQGELLVFPDPEPRLRILDAFEGFRPAPRERTYERVLLPVSVHKSAWSTQRIELAWAYVLPPYVDLPEVEVASDTWHPWLG